MYSLGELWTDGVGQGLFSLRDTAIFSRSRTESTCITTFIRLLHHERGRQSRSNLGLEIELESKSNKALRIIIGHPLFHPPPISSPRVLGYPSLYSLDGSALVSFRSIGHLRSPTCGVRNMVATHRHDDAPAPNAMLPMPSPTSTLLICMGRPRAGDRYIMLVHATHIPLH